MYYVLSSYINFFLFVLLVASANILHSRSFFLVQNIDPTVTPFMFILINYYFDINDWYALLFSFDINDWYAVLFSKYFCGFCVTCVVVVVIYFFFFQKQECSELRKERNKKGGQLNNVSSKNKEKEAVLCHSKNTNSWVMQLLLYFLHTENILTGNVIFSH